MQHNEELTDGLLVTGFTLGASDFGVDARLVQEVVKAGKLTPVHNAPPGVIGIRNLRGRIVTVIDMATHLDLGSVTVSPESHLLIMEDQGESYGFLVDTVTDAFSLDKEHSAPPPASLDSALRSRLSGVWRKADRLTSILDPKTLFQWEDPSQ